jgi:fatty-acyl-CoA synthase
MFIAELDHPDFPSYDLSSLRTGIMAGAPATAAGAERTGRSGNTEEIGRHSAQPSCQQKSSG